MPRCLSALVETDADCMNIVDSALVSNAADAEAKPRVQSAATSDDANISLVPGAWLQGPPRIALLELVANEFTKPLEGTTEDLDASSLFWQGAYSKGLGLRPSHVPRHLRGGLSQFSVACRGVMAAERSTSSTANVAMMHILNDLILAAGTEASSSKPRQKRTRADTASKRDGLDGQWVQVAAAQLDAWRSQMQDEDSCNEIVIGAVGDEAVTLAKAYLTALASGHIDSEVSSGIQTAVLDLVQLAVAFEAKDFTPLASSSSRYSARLTDGHVWVVRKACYDALVACANVVGAKTVPAEQCAKRQRNGPELQCASAGLAEKLLTLEQGGCSISGMGFLSRASESVARVAGDLLAASIVEKAPVEDGSPICEDAALCEVTACSGVYRVQWTPLLRCLGSADIAVLSDDDDNDAEKENDDDVPLTALDDDIPLTALH